MFIMQIVICVGILVQRLVGDAVAIAESMTIIYREPTTTNPFWTIVGSCHVKHEKEFKAAFLNGKYNRL